MLRFGWPEPSCGGGYLAGRGVIDPCGRKPMARQAALKASRVGCSVRLPFSDDKGWAFWPEDINCERWSATMRKMWMSLEVGQYEDKTR